MPSVVCGGKGHRLVAHDRHVAAATPHALRWSQQPGTVSDGLDAPLAQLAERSRARERPGVVRTKSAGARRGQQSGAGGTAQGCPW
jgi:hypothetical protein